jgi:hypothetical protein
MPLASLLHVFYYPIFSKGTYSWASSSHALTVLTSWILTILPPYLFRINLPLFSTVLPSNSRFFLSCRPFVVITFSTGLVDVEVTSVSWLGQLTVVIKTKGQQDRNNLLLAGRTVENKCKLILTEIFPSVQKHDI